MINPPGPTKRETLAIGGGFSFEGYAGGDRIQRFDNMRLQEHVGRQSAATAPRRGESARGKRARNNPPGPTKRETLAIGGGFSFGGMRMSNQPLRVEDIKQRLFNDPLFSMEERCNAYPELFLNGYMVADAYDHSEHQSLCKGEAGTQN